MFTVIVALALKFAPILAVAVYAGLNEAIYRSALKSNTGIEFVLNVLKKLAGK